VNNLSARCSRYALRLPLVSALCALSLFATFATSTALAAPATATDLFTGTAAIPAGQTSPVQISPTDVTVRADGAVGLGYVYRASGRATGQLPGTFTYEEHGYLYFSNPSDPASMLGSRFVSGVFTLTAPHRTKPVVIADTSPANYTSGIQTLVVKLGPQAGRLAGALRGQPGPLTYGYFTFTNSQGTFTGYATPDFTRFAIQITFPVPA
jgi:hypothetical protein